MILMPHMLVGATIGARIKNFGVIFVISILLHFLFDRLPHWEYIKKIDIKKGISRRKLSSIFCRAVIDLSLGAGIIWLFWKDSPHLFFIVFGAFISILPDGLVFLHLLIRAMGKREIPLLRNFYNFHEKIHISEHGNFPIWGLATESLIVVLAFYLIS